MPADLSDSQKDKDYDQNDEGGEGADSEEDTGPLPQIITKPLHKVVIAGSDVELPCDIKDAGKDEKNK